MCKKKKKKGVGRDEGIKLTDSEERKVVQGPRSGSGAGRLPGTKKQRTEEHGRAGELNEVALNILGIKVERRERGEVGGKHKHTHTHSLAREAGKRLRDGWWGGVGGSRVEG